MKFSSRKNKVTVLGKQDVGVVGNSGRGRRVQVHRSMG